jgi:hypothetical protein
MDIVLTILKLAGLVLAGAFGALGLLKDFRDDKTKVLTKWGKIALYGILASTALAFIAQALDSAKSAHDAKESEMRAQDQIARSNEILTDLNRSLNPLTNVRVTYWLTVPFEAPEFAAYRERLAKGVAEILASPSQAATLGTGYVSVGDAHGRPEAVAIPHSSPLMPQRDEVIPYYVLRYSGLSFAFFKSPRPDAELRAEQTASAQPDLSFDVGTVGTDTGEKTSEDYSLDFDLESKKLTIFASDLASDPQYWRSNNHILAVPDLSNARLGVQIDDTMVPMVPTLPVGGERNATGQTLSRLRSQMQLESLILKINTRELWIKGRDRDMKRLESSGPRRFVSYEMVFPKAVDDLQLSRHR